MTAQLAAERKAKRPAKRPREGVEILRARRLLADNVSFERAWHELNDLRNRPTPQVTVEAIILCVRERGVGTLKEPENIERLARCDENAKAQIDVRIARLQGAEP